MKLHRKLIALLLTAVLLLGTLALPASAAELPFTDVPDNEWYTDAVKYAYENNLFQGEGNGKFNPNGSMTRAMFVQVLANKANNYNKADWAGKSSFSDVNKDKWYAAPVEWASKAGLVSGKGNGKFDPNGKVTRQEMAVIMYRYAKATGNDTSFNSSALSGFSDASSVSGWAKEAMQWAVTHKVIAGSGGKLNPTGNAKRCEVAQVTKNADPILVKNEVEISNTPDPTPNPDPTPDDLPEGALTYQEFKAMFPNEELLSDCIIRLTGNYASNEQVLPKRQLNATGIDTLRLYAIAWAEEIIDHFGNDNLDQYNFQFSLGSRGLDMTLSYYPGRQDHYFTKGIWDV